MSKCLFVCFLILFRNGIYCGPNINLLTDYLLDWIRFSGWWKNVAKGLVANDGGDCGNGKGHESLSIGALMDILAAGKMMSWNAGVSSGVRYCVKMKLMDQSISRQNRMILCKAVPIEDEEMCEDGGGRGIRKKKDKAHARLTRAYHRAHRLPNQIGLSKVAKEPPGWQKNETRISLTTWCVRSLLVGVCIGTVLSLSITSVIKKK